MNILPLALVVATCLSAAPGHRRTWALGTFSWVKLERQEPGAPANAQPCAMPRAALAGILTSLTIPAGPDREPLFLAEEAARLAEPMAEALAVADPGEDLIFMSTVKRGGGFMAPRLTVTGRVFVLEGRLNVIIQETRLEYDGRVRANDTPPLPGNGQRARPGAAVIAAPGAVALRGDWLAFPLDAAPPAVPSPVQPASQPAVTVAPAPAAVPPVLPAAAKPAAPPTLAEERLRAIKRLREQNLLTEAEYQKKRQEIIKDL